MKVSDYGSSSSGSRKSLNQNAKLEGGDKFKALILDIRPGEVTLQLSNGNVINAKCAQIPDARIGETATFSVRSNENGKLIIKFFKEANDNAFSDLGLQALKGARLPITDENLKAASALVKSDIPVDINSLTKAIGIMQQYKEIDIDQMLMMVRENLDITDENIMLLEKHLSRDECIKPAMGALVKALSGVEDKKLANLVCALFLENVSDKQKEFIGGFLKYMSGGGKNKISTPEFLKVIMKVDRKKIIEMLKHSLFIEPKNSFVADKYLNRLYNAIKISDESLQNFKGSNWDGLKNVLSSIKNDMDFLKSFSHSEFQRIPYKINNSYNEAKLFVFGNKKNKAIKDLTTAVLVLNTASLGRLEILVQKEGKNVRCRFGVSGEEEKNFLIKDIVKLKQSINNLGYIFTDASFDITSELIEKLGNWNNSEEIEGSRDKRYGFDLRV